MALKFFFFFFFFFWYCFWTLIQYCDILDLNNSFVLLLRKGCYLFTHPGYFSSKRSSTPTKMFEELILNLEILRGELNVEGILIIEHREEKINNHVLQSNGEFAN